MKVVLRTVLLLILAHPSLTMAQRDPLADWDLQNQLSPVTLVLQGAVTPGELLIVTISNSHPLVHDLGVPMKARTLTKITDSDTVAGSAVSMASDKEFILKVLKYDPSASIKGGDSLTVKGTDVQLVRLDPLTADGNKEQIDTIVYDDPVSAHLLDGWFKDTPNPNEIRAYMVVAVAYAKYFEVSESSSKAIIGGYGMAPPKCDGSATALPSADSLLPKNDATPQTTTDPTPTRGSAKTTPNSTSAPTATTPDTGSTTPPHTPQTPGSLTRPATSPSGAASAHQGSSTTNAAKDGVVAGGQAALSDLGSSAHSQQKSDGGGEAASPFAIGGGVCTNALGEVVLRAAKPVPIGIQVVSVSPDSTKPNGYNWTSAQFDLTPKH